MSKATSLFLFYLLFMTGYSQTSIRAKNIDSLCVRIDTISKDFKKVVFKRLGRSDNKSYATFHVYYIDTLNNHFRKVTYYKQKNKLLKSFYYEDKSLINVTVETRDKSNQTATFQFKTDKLIYKKDVNKLVKRPSELIMEAIEYLEDPIVIH